MAGIKDKVGRLKDWMVPEDETSDEEYDRYEEDDMMEDDSYEEYDRYEEEETRIDSHPSIKSRVSGVSDYHSSHMKVIIVEPKIYEDAPIVANHLKMQKIVVVNLENLEDKKAKKSIFDFMNGAVYVLDASIQRVSKAIFILAPKNVDVDANIKNELESKALFPWQTN